MKKALTLLLSACLLISAAACSAQPAAPASSSAAPASSEAAPASSDAAPASSEASEAAPAEEADAWAAATGAKVFPAIAKEALKVGFIYVGDVGDMGYSYAHDQGRLAMIQNLGLTEEQVLVVTNVPEDSTCEDHLRNLIDQGCNVIFTTSFGHMDWTANVAREFPDVIFLHCSGYTTGENMTAYFGRMYEARYLSGIAAGLKAKEINNPKLGYVAAMPISEVIRGLNAFALGVKSVYPEATVEVKWTNSWYDPALEKQSALDLLNSGVGVLGQHVDTTAPQVAAEEKGAFAVGYNAATLTAAPKAYLTSPLWDWGVFYTDQVQKVMDGQWSSSDAWLEASTGIVGLDALSENCAAGTQEAIDAAKAAIDSGENKIFVGPLNDNTGAQKLADGEVMSDLAMYQEFNWLVDNVVGSVG